MAFIKTYRFSLLAIVVVLLLNSCKKDKPTTDPASQLKGTYKSGTYFTLSGTQMFTVNGQVQDAAILSSFIKRMDLPFNSGEKQSLYFKPFVINFTGDETAIVDLPNNHGGVVPTKFTITDKTESGFILRQNDIFKSSVSQSNSRIARLVDISNLIEQTVNCQSSPAGQTQCDYVRRLPFTFSNSAINLSYYTIAIYSEQAGSTQLAAITDEPGIFNKTITTQLIAGDTLVVQAKYQQFSKK